MARKRRLHRPQPHRRPAPASEGGSQAPASQAPAFDRIYLDSEPLIGARWPRISTGMVNVLTHARTLGISVFLPEATEKELEAHWLREANELIRSVNAHMGGVTEMSMPTLETLRTNYRAKVAEAKARYEIQTVSMPRRSLADVFDQWLAGRSVSQAQLKLRGDPRRSLRH